MFRIRHGQSGVLGGAATRAVLVLVFSCAVSAATLNVRVETDKAVYRVGGTVSWRIYAWASEGDNYGVQALTVAIDDSTSDTVNPPLVEGAEFKNTAYGTDEKFLVMGFPVSIQDITVMQMPFDPYVNVGNDGQTDHILAVGSYTVNEMGTHRLAVTFNGDGGNYWQDPAGGMNPLPFESTGSAPAVFTVEPNADINRDMYVNFADYAVIAAAFMRDDCAATSDCDGADLNLDGVVSLADIVYLASQWLSCTDPANPSCN